MTEHLLVFRILLPAKLAPKLEKSQKSSAFCSHKTNIKGKAKSTIILSHQLNSQGLEKVKGKGPKVLQRVYTYFGLVFSFEEWI